MENSGRTIVCSVLFLDIVEYSKQSVDDQIKLKQAFNRTLSKALEAVAARDRVILDTGDGAAIAFLGDPEDALFVAIAIRGNTDLPVRMGVNLGPVRLVKDINGQANIIGDGINVAQRVMSFGEPGAILVSRSYYEVVSRLSDDYGQIFHDAGTRTDKHVREHSVYAVGALPRNTGQLQSNSDTPRENQIAENQFDSSGIGDTAPLTEKPARMSPYMLVGVPVIAIAIIAIGVLLRLELGKGSEVTTLPKAAPASSLAPVVKSAEAPLAVKEQDNPPVPETRKPVVIKGKIILAIVPWGEVLVDARTRGSSPPLKSLMLVPGKHVIEIRNTTFPAYRETVDVKSGATLKVQHKF